MNGTSSAAGLVAALLALAASPAGASPGNGIRLGGSEGRLHPYLDLEGRWDSNVFYTQAGEAVADVIVHVRPGFSLSVPGDVLAVDLGANLDWAQYLGLDAEANTDDLSRAYASASLGVTANRRGTVGFELDDRFDRSASTSAFTFDGAVISNRNVLDLRVPWRPGRGALVLSLTGGWTLETFEPFDACDPGATSVTCDAATLEDLGYDDVRVGGEVRWKFLPRTSAVLQGGWFSRMPNDPTLSHEVTGFDARAGVSGLVTPRIGATLKAGYASTDDSVEGGWGTWLATVEVEWIATDAATVRFGWKHDYGIDPGSDLSVYGLDLVVVSARYALAGRYGARLEASWERRDYAFQDDSTTADMIRVDPSLEAAVNRWLNASLGYAYSSRTSSFASTTPSGFEYDKSEVWLRLVATY